MRSVKGRILFLVVSSVIMMAGVALLTAHGLESGPVPFAAERGGPGGEEGPLPDADPSEQQSALPSLEGKTLNVLFCGIDNTSALADVILLAQLDFSEHAVRLLQIPRDTYIGEPYRTGKLNEACLSFASENPTERIAEILREDFKLPVDYYVAVTLEGVREIVNIAGGVVVDIPQKIDYLPGKTLSPGVQTLDGEHAEWFLRYRSGYQTGDIGRLNAQRAFLIGAVRTVKGMGKMKALSVAMSCYNKVKTDIPLSLLLSAVQEGMQVEEEKIEFYMMPCYGTSYGSYSVVVANRYKFADIINLFRPQEPVSPWNLVISQPPAPADSGEGETDRAQTEEVQQEPLFDFSWDESWGGAEEEGIVLRRQDAEGG